MPAPAINHVSDTALWVASYRAAESARPDALFKDPLAHQLAGDQGRAIAGHVGGSRYVAWSVVVRTCIIDAFIRRLLNEGVDTILNLGAGLDTRPYRLELNDKVRWIEVDYPHVIAHKERHLQNAEPRCRLERVKLDLADRPARQHLFAQIRAQSQKVLVLTEGVVPYFSNEHAAALADDLHDAGNFSCWLLDYFSSRLIKYMRDGKLRRQMRNAPFRFDPPEYFAFFEEHGWHARETRYLGEESEKLGRPIPAPWFFKILRRFLPAKQRLAMKRFSAYVLMERK